MNINVFTFVAIFSGLTIVRSELYFDAEDTGVLPKTVKDRNVIADNSTDLSLKCTGDQVKWILPGDVKNRVTEAYSNETGAANLIIRNVTVDDNNTYTCHYPDTLEHFHLSVIVPTVNLTNSRSNFVRNGGRIELSCIVTSVSPVNEVLWYHNYTRITSDLPGWHSKNRICFTKEQTNCVFETKFSLTIDNAGMSDGGIYGCAAPLKYAMLAEIDIEVIDEPHIILRKNVGPKTTNVITEYAKEALEEHGLTQELPKTIRTKCDINYGPHWNCIVGQKFHVYDIAVDSDRAAIEFSFGSVNFLIYETR